MENKSLDSMLAGYFSQISAESELRFTMPSPPPVPVSLTARRALAGVLAAVLLVSSGVFGYLMNHSAGDFSAMTSVPSGNSSSSTDESSSASHSSGKESSTYAPENSIPDWYTPAKLSVRGITFSSSVQAKANTGFSGAARNPRLLQTAVRNLAAGVPNAKSIVLGYDGNYELHSSVNAEILRIQNKNDLERIIYYNTFLEKTIDVEALAGDALKKAGILKAGDSVHVNEYGSSDEFAVVSVYQEKFQNEKGTYLYSFKDRSVRKFPQSAAFVSFDQSISPNGKTYLFTKTKDGEDSWRDHVYLVDLAAMSVRDLSVDGNRVYNAFLYAGYSPKGNYVIFSTRDASGNRLPELESPHMVYDVARGKYLSFSGRPVRFTSDDQSLIFEDLRGYKRIHLATGKIEALADTRGLEPYELYEITETQNSGSPLLTNVLVKNMVTGDTDEIQNVRCMIRSKDGRNLYYYLADSEILIVRELNSSNTFRIRLDRTFLDGAQADAESFDLMYRLDVSRSGTDILIYYMKIPKSSPPENPQPSDDQTYGLFSQLEKLFQNADSLLSMKEFFVKHASCMALYQGTGFSYMTFRDGESHLYAILEDRRDNSMALYAHGSSALWSEYHIWRDSTIKTPAGSPGKDWLEQLSKFAESAGIQVHNAELDYKQGYQNGKFNPSVMAQYIYNADKMVDGYEYFYVMPYGGGICYEIYDRAQREALCDVFRRCTWNTTTIAFSAKIYAGELRRLVLSADGGRNRLVCTVSQLKDGKKVLDINNFYSYLSEADYSTLKNLYDNNLDSFAPLP